MRRKAEASCPVSSVRPVYSVKVSDSELFGFRLMWVQISARSRRGEEMFQKHPEKQDHCQEADGHKRKQDPVLDGELKPVLSFHCRASFFEKRNRAAEEISTPNMAGCSVR